MDRVVLVTDRPQWAFATQAALALSGWMVARRRPDDIDEIAVDQPDVLVLDAAHTGRGAGRRQTPLADRVTALLAAPGISEEIPVLAVVADGRAGEAAACRALTDFVLSPERPGELQARLRRAIAKGPYLPGEEDDRVVVGALTVDRHGHEATLHGERVAFTFQEFRLLRFLAGHPDRAFTRDQILTRVWGFDYFGGARTVDIHVRRIRSKLGLYAACIQTVRHVGYKWVPDEAPDEGGAQSTT